MLKKLIATTVLAGTILGATSVAAFAQDAREAEMIGLHQLCNQGDRRACIKFGMMIQQNHDRMDAWRRTHPEWFWWER
jgi:hypothetical protein